jgi:hypothetical protein
LGHLSILGPRGDGQLIHAVLGDIDSNEFPSRVRVGDQDTPWYLVYRWKIAGGQHEIVRIGKAGLRGRAVEMLPAFQYCPGKEVVLHAVLGGEKDKVNREHEAGIFG